MRRTRTVVLLGPPGAGKTSFFNRCVREGEEYTFNPKHVSTSRIDTHDFTRKAGETNVEYTVVSLRGRMNNVTPLQVDTMGGAVFGTHMTGGSVFVGCRVILFMFDLNSKRSWSDLISSDRFDNIEYEIARRKGRMEKIDCFVIGTHSDLPHKVDTEEIDEFVENAKTSSDSEVPVNFFRLDRKFFKCSSKTGEGIGEILDYVAKAMARDGGPAEEDDKVIRLNIKTKADGKSNSDCC